MMKKSQIYKIILIGLIAGLFAYLEYEYLTNYKVFIHNEAAPDG